MAIRKILQADIIRMQATKPENTSLAAAYFKQRPMHNSTHIAASKIKKETGNIPVVGRGGPGVRPKHGAETMLIEPMPIEIDDTISAVEMDEYNRATDMGKNQIIDEFTSEHYDIVRETMNALCCQAHRGKIDYMMKTESGPQRYVVEYGTAEEIAAMTENLPETLGNADYAYFTKLFAKMAQKLKTNGVGGPVEFIAAGNVFGHIIDLVTAKPNSRNTIGDGYVTVGQFKVYCDNDSYKDKVNGSFVTKSLCDDGEIVCRAVNAGQSMPFCKLDDTVQQNAVAFYTFTVERDDHRGEDIYSKSKPFPIVNIKGICWAKFAGNGTSHKVTFSAGQHGTLAAAIGEDAVTSGSLVAEGSTVVFTATPADGYKVKAWGGASKDSLVDAGTNAVSLVVDGKTNITVTFEASTPSG